MSPAQRRALRWLAKAGHFGTGGTIEFSIDTGLNGAAATAVLQSLVRRGYAQEDRGDYNITPTGERAFAQELRP